MSSLRRAIEQADYATASGLLSQGRALPADPGEALELLEWALRAVRTQRAHVARRVERLPRRIGAYRNPTRPPASWSLEG